MSRTEFSIRVPFDAHVHFRQGDILQAVAPITALHFWGACAMPNTTPPITTSEAARSYRSAIEDAVRIVRSDFVANVGLYMTEELLPDEVRRAYDGFRDRRNSPRRAADFIKYYPKGGTTNSKHGVIDIMSCRKVLETAEEIGMPVCLHGERVLKPSGSVIDHLDRERYFVEGPLEELLNAFPKLRVVLEHVSSKEGIERVMDDSSDRLAASITPHHTLFTHADLFEGGMRPHLNNMPVFKHDEDRKAIRTAMFSGDHRFFAGSDSAPHPVHKKHSACCPFGIFNAAGLLERYATTWSEAGKLDEYGGVKRFEDFMSVNGPRFYGLEPSDKHITLTHEPWEMNESDAVRVKTLPNQEELDEVFYPLGHPASGVMSFAWKIKT